MMDVKRIVVDELPESCFSCQFVEHFEMYKSNCRITHKGAYSASRPEHCPLVVEKVCEWVREKTDRGYAAFYIPKDHKQHPDCYTQDADTYKYCPSCGRRIVYKESEE